MRHLKKTNHLSRQRGHRLAMLSNMACSLIEHKRIRTTLAKAKALRIFVEPIMTRGKEDSTHSRRMVFRTLQNKDAVTELFREIAPKIADRPGGYTRILKTGSRYGDAAEMALIELVDYNENMLKDSSDKKKSRRSRRGGAKKAVASAGAAVAGAAGDVAEKAENVVKDVKDTAADVAKKTTDAAKDVKDAAKDVTDGNDKKKDDDK